MAFALMALGVLAVGAGLLLASGLASLLWILIAAVLIVGGLLFAALQGIKEQIATLDERTAPRQVNPQ